LKFFSLLRVKRFEEKVTKTPARKGRAVRKEPEEAIMKALGGVRP